MTLSPVAVESFGGLRLDLDPGEVGWNGAIDLLDVDINPRGTVRERDRFEAYVANTSMTDPSVLSWPVTGILASDPSTLKLYSVAGTSLIGTAVAPNQYFQSGVAAFGTPTTSYLYLADHANTNAIRRLTTAGVISAPPGMPTAKYLTRTPNDNRLVAACVSGHTSRVQFSDDGDAETWGANNYIDLDPGDGEDIQGCCTWRDLLFVFKLTKFYVFYGTSEDGAGDPIFNYRAVRAGVGGADNGTGAALGVGPEGVYFASIADVGFAIYRTTGDTPVRISQAIDPTIAGRNPTPFFTPANLSGGAGSAAYAGERFSFVPLDGSVLGRYIFHFDPALDAWLIDYTAANTTYLAPSPYGNFLLATVNGSNAPIHGKTPGYTGTDSLHMPVSRYRSGFADLGSPDVKRIHSWRLQGSGSPTLKLSTNFGSLETGAAVTLGTAPAVAEGVRRYAPKGRQFSWQLGASSAWSVNSLVANVAGKRDTADH